MNHCKEVPIHSATETKLVSRQKVIDTAQSATYLACFAGSLVCITQNMYSCTIHTFLNLDNTSYTVACAIGP